MVKSLTPKTVGATRITLSQLMQPEHANHHGNVHGGWIMKLADEAGALACIRHAQHRVVTVAVDQFIFKHPIRIGDLVILNAEVSYVGTTSVEAEVNVYAENPMTCQRWHTNTAYLVYVALDDDGNPTKVPPLILDTDRERQRFTDGKERQDRRLNASSYSDPEGVDQSE